MNKVNYMAKGLRVVTHIITEAALRVLSCLDLLLHLMDFKDAQDYLGIIAQY